MEAAADREEPLGELTYRAAFSIRTVEWRRSRNEVERIENQTKSHRSEECTTKKRWLLVCRPVGLTSNVS